MNEIAAADLQNRTNDAKTMMDEQGYVVIRGAIGTEKLEQMQTTFARVFADWGDKVRDFGGQSVVHSFIEQDPIFEDLMDWPTTYPLVREVIGPDVSLASAGSGYEKPPHTGSSISWHNDFMWMVNVPYPRQNFWARCSFFLSDVKENGGAFTLLPGSHLSDGPPSKDLTDENGQPKPMDGMIKITAKAGDCLINNTEIWHCNSPNESDDPRHVIMLTYKHLWMKQWQEPSTISEDFAERQTCPRRRQLCNIGVWHKVDGKFNG